MNKQKNKPNGLNRSYHFNYFCLFLNFLLHNCFTTKIENFLWRDLDWNLIISYMYTNKPNSELLKLFVWVLSPNKQCSEQKLVNKVKATNRDYSELKSTREIHRKSQVKQISTPKSWQTQTSLNGNVQPSVGPTRVIRGPKRLLIQ